MHIYFNFDFEICTKVVCYWIGIATHAWYLNTHFFDCAGCERERAGCVTPVFTLAAQYERASIHPAWRAIWETKRPWLERCCVDVVAHKRHQLSSQRSLTLPFNCVKPNTVYYAALIWCLTHFAIYTHRHRAAFAERAENWKVASDGYYFIPAGARIGCACRKAARRTMKKRKPEPPRVCAPTHILRNLLLPNV